jgi:type II secretory pathway pseudopilin PulG
VKINKKIFRNRISSRPYGFTFVEAIIVTLIACSLMIIIQTFFSHAVRSTIKGQDNLDSIRAASQIFSSLRQDMLQFQSVSTDGAIAEIALGETDIPSTATYSSMLTLNRPDEIITYSLVDNGGKSFIERVSQNLTTGTNKKKLFGVPRMKDFKVLYLRMPNKVNSLVKNVGQIIVEVKIDSEDSRFASKELDLGSLMFSERLNETDWNYMSL